MGSVSDWLNGLAVAFACGGAAFALWRKRKRRKGACGCAQTQPPPFRKAK